MLPTFIRMMGALIRPAASTQPLYRFLIGELKDGCLGSGFENDDASDWLAHFCDAPNKQLIADALGTLVDMDAAQYLEAPDCSVAIAAAEIVAAQRGAANPNLTAKAKSV